MAITFERTRMINCLKISVGPRHLEPTPENIKKMAESLSLPQGQLTPIVVTAVTKNSYELVAGATRLRAAIDILHWKEIRAEIINGHPLDYKMFELTENLDRHDLTREQRRKMRERRTELECELLQNVEPAKGGRGRKGGLRDAARQAGMSHTTAQRRKEDKLAQNNENGPVSDQPEPAAAASKSTASARIAPRQLSFKMTLADYELLKASALARRKSMAELVRELVRDFIQQQNSTQITEQRTIQ
jgi:hypothetical protein